MLSNRPSLQKKLNSILVKPAGPDCNMGCAYCFYLEKAELFSESRTHRMSENILEEMIKQVMSQGEQQVSFGWQGGEPTLMSIPFFEKVIEFQKSYGSGHSVGNGLQTNGILIEKRWAKFLSTYSFLVGLSLDGPEHIHDRYRLLRNGKGSWSQVVDRAKLLLDSDVEVNALTVLNDYSVKFPEEIYAFLKSIGLNYMQFIPCVEKDPKDPSQTAFFSVSPEKYGEFLCKLFDLWKADFVENVPTTSIRYFDSVFYNYVELPAPDCTLGKSCGVYVVVEYNGNVYSCDFFVEPGWKLGNVMEDKLIFMLNSEHQKKFGQKKAALPRDCKECRWLRYCWGGCTKDRQNNPQEKSMNYLCTSYKMFFSHADAQMSKMAEEWKGQQNLAGKKQMGREPSLTASNKIGRNDPCPCGSGQKYKKCCGKDS